MKQMRRYRVLFDFGSYDYEVTHVYAENTQEVRRIMRGQFGRDVKIREIEEECV